jgi:hypothetical protein
LEEISEGPHRFSTIEQIRFSLFYTMNSSSLVS